MLKAWGMHSGKEEEEEEEREMEEEENEGRKGMRKLTKTLFYR